MREEVKRELLSDIIPFWKGLRDDTYGGYYGWLSYDLKREEKAEKGCILNSRILWFFSNVYTLYRQGLITEEECQTAGYTGESLLAEARHAYEFLQEHCLDEEYGGIYWSLKYDGTPLDTTKHTYNQAFAIYALSSYYEASGDEKALENAYRLFTLIEERCTDEAGYLEAFTRDFLPESNEKLSENGVLADKTMNTLLHVFEAYTELYRVSDTDRICALCTGEKQEKCSDTENVLNSLQIKQRVRERLMWILDVFADKVYNPKLHRQEVFFDAEYHSILDLHSYGHDIETAWLVDRGVEVLGDASYKEKMEPITKALTAQIYKTAFDGHSLANECDRSVVNANRVWWVQAETVVGFLNGYEKSPEYTEYLDAAKAQWEFIKEYVIDKREGSEWYWEVRADGTPIAGRPIVEPWKCPYHNGRMCMEVLRRIQ